MITIFTDGASKGNPGSGGWGSVIVGSGNVVELGGHEEKTTNNRMEVLAIIEALTYIQRNYNDRDEKVHVFSDSTYAVKGITQWIDGWIARGWVTASKDPVSNKDLWERFHEVIQNLSIEWTILPGHSGIAGNERADTIASTFAEGNVPDLYNGSLDGYEIDIMNMDIDKALKTQKDAKKNRSKQKAYSYLSLLDGMLKRHSTWAECSARVEGKSGARFRKSLSAEDEIDIVESWGKTFDDIR